MSSFVIPPARSGSELRWEPTHRGASAHTASCSRRAVLRSKANNATWVLRTGTRVDSAPACVTTPCRDCVFGRGHRSFGLSGADDRRPEYLRGAGAHPGGIGPRVGAAVGETGDLPRGHGLDPGA